MAIIPGVYQAKNAISDNSQQGSKFNSIVNAIVNPANTSLLTGFDPVIEEVSSPNAGTVVTYIPHTVSGTPPLSLPNSAGQPLESWSVDVLPYQEGSGDPSPDNVRPIHGTDKLTITTAGKNLYSSATIEAGYINASGVITDPTSYQFCHTDFIPVTGEPMMWSGISGIGNTKRLHCYRADKSWISNPYVYSGLTGEPYSLGGSLPQGTAFVRMSFAFSDTNVQLEYGTAVTEYYPAAPSQTVLTLPQTVYTGTIGSEGGESRSAELIADDSLNWSVFASNNTNIVFSVNVLPYGMTVEIGQISNMFVRHPYAYALSDSSRQNTFVLGISGNLFVQVSIAEYPDVDTFKALLAVTPLHIVHPLATPTTFAVPSVTIPTPTGTAATWATAEDGTVDGMEVTYIKSE